MTTPETPNPTDVAATDPEPTPTPAPAAPESTLHRYLDEIEKLLAKVRAHLKGGNA